MNGTQFKNSYNVSEYCLQEYISTISDDKYYVSNSLPTAGYPKLYQPNESSDYIDVSALSISYPNIPRSPTMWILRVAWCITRRGKRSLISESTRVV